MFSKVKGTQDFLDLTLFNFFLDKASSHLKKYNFNQIDTPVLEPTELFKRSLGLHTDVVTKEMYTLGSSSKEEDSICLRPEVTASTMRAFLENKIDLLPWKVFSWGPMFRKERPQKGRFRQFHQLDIEVIGSESVAQDAFFISMLDRFFHEELSLDTYTLQINFLGQPEDRQNHKKKLEVFLDKHLDSLCNDCKERRHKNIMRVFDCKKETCKKLYKDAPYIVDSLSGDSLKEWQELQSLLELLSVSFSYNPTLVRGLDYYNKTVFEFTSSSLGAQDAFCAGGRYDYLAAQLGSSHDYPSLGVAMGIERILLLLEQIKDRLKIQQQPPLYVILPLSEKQYSLALLLADQMQSNGLCIDIVFDKPSVKSLLRRANKMAASCAILVGEQEQKNNEVLVKNMVTGQEERVLQANIVEYLKK